MGLFSFLTRSQTAPEAETEQRSINITATPVSVSTLGNSNWFWSAPSDTGVEVNEFSALSNTAVFAAIKLLSDTIGFMDLPVYARQERGKKRLDNHAVSRVLQSPNEAMTGITFRSLLMSHVLGWGNAYAYIDFDEQMNVQNLLPLLPDRTYPYRLTSGELVYFTRVNGAEVPLAPYQVFHVPGFSFDGLSGLSPIQLHKQSIGLGLAYDKFGAKLFGNGLNTGGILKVPTGLSPQAVERLRTQIQAKQTGLDNAHKFMVLEEGMTFDRTTINPDDAQFIESKKFSISDIARIFSVPPHLIGDLERSTNNNIEQQSLDFKTYSLNPWLSRWEQEVNRKLFLTSERGSCFAKFDDSSLLRTDSKSRSEYYKSMSSYFTINEVREMEDKNPIPNGDVILIQTQNTTLDNIIEQAEAAETTDDTATDAKEIQQTVEATETEDNANAPAAPQAGIADIVEALTVADVISTRSKLDAQFQPLFRYAVTQKPGATQLRQIITPYVHAVRSAVAGEFKSTEKRSADTSNQFESFMDKYCEAASIRMSKSDKSADDQCEYEMRRCRNAVTRESYRDAGVKTLRWIGGAHDGKTAAIDEAFVTEENRKLYHPPMDYGCKSEIVAG